MNRRRGLLMAGLGALLAGAATVVLASGVGLAAVSANRADPVEHFFLMTTEPSSATYVVIAGGYFTTSGIDISGSTIDTLKFPHGTIKIDHGSNVHVIKQELNFKTCLAVFEGTAKFTLGRGTGAYRKLTGSGTAVINETAIFARTRNGVCNSNANPVTNEQTITATAHVKY